MDTPKKNRAFLSNINLSPFLKFLNKKKPCLTILRHEKMKSNNNTLLSISITLLFKLPLQSSFY